MKYICRTNSADSSRLQTRPVQVSGLWLCAIILQMQRATRVWGRFWWNRLRRYEICYLSEKLYTPKNVIRPPSTEVLWLPLSLRPLESVTDLFMPSIICSDNSTRPSPPPVWYCQPNEFRCEYSGQCIPSYLRCDGRRDCKDNSDETNCKLRDINL